LEARCSYESTSSAIRTVIGEPQGGEERFRAGDCDVGGWSGGLLFKYDNVVINGAIGYLSVHYGLTPIAIGWRRVAR
jgi:hypothetical protein